LLTKYNIPDPVFDDAIGVFADKDLKTLYDTLVAQGSKSLTDALTVGATIEDLDLSDLKRYLSQVDNKDITFVYENLMRGSRNHLRAFTRQLSAQGGSYDPQHITAEEYTTIISAEQETGYGSGGVGRAGGRGWGNR
jgi:tRNA isopentenyl-2-thiomethyl-A-37 hydroxylase MiaE